MLCNLRDSRGIAVANLKEATQDVRRTITRPQILDEIFFVRGMEELYLDGKISMFQSIQPKGQQS